MRSLDPDFGIFSDPAESGEERFSYDAAGNLYDAAGCDYAAGNQLVRRGATEYFWNQAGQLEEKRRRTSTGVEISRYTWNAAGLLESVDLPDGRQVTFAYDPFARRIHKRVLSPETDPLPFGGRRALLTETRFFWGGQRLAHEITRRLATLEPDGPRPVLDPTSPEPHLRPPEVRTYCHEDGSHTVVAGKLPDGTWAFYVNDAVGTPEALVGEDGEPLGTLERRAWRMKESKGLTPFRFPGQYEDEETGLCYNRYRYYDPDLGRFVSADPVGLRGGTNVFSYAPSALTWLDPLGLARVCDRLQERPTEEQQALIDMAKEDSRRVPRGKGPVSSGDADAYIELANQTGVPVRAKANDLTGAHGYGPVPPGPTACHIHINGEHVPVPQGYVPPPGASVIR